MILLPLAWASDIGPYDRYRVEIPDFPGSVASSEYGSVLLEPPPEGIPYTLEEPPVPDGFVAEEAVEAMALSPWHEAGFTGKGVKIAVFDVQLYGADVDPELGAFETHDCEAHTSCALSVDTLRPRYSFEEGSHGVACAEVIRDMAPDAELHLVQVNGVTTMENAGRWAADNDIDIVSMSMSFFNNSFYDGGGLVNDAVDRLRSGGVLLVNSAGNYATEHWDGDYVDYDGDGAMDFPWGSPYLPVYYGAGEATIYVSWDQFHACGDTDFDAYLYSHEGLLLGRSEGIQDAAGTSCSPVERISATIPENGWQYLKIVRHSGNPVVHLAVFARDGTAYQATPGGLADPASSVAAFTVGAVRADGYLRNGREGFSSTGPTHSGLAKPDISGPDGLSTSVYGTLGFYGTSASTPAVAGTLALVMQAHPGWTAFDAADFLKANALDAPDLWSGPDGDIGAGKVRLPAPDATPGCQAGGAWLLLFPFGIARRRR